MNSWIDSLENSSSSRELTDSALGLRALARDADSAREQLIAAIADSARQLARLERDAREGRQVSDPARCSTFQDMAELAARSRALDESLFLMLVVVCGHEGAVAVRAAHLSSL